MTGWGAVENCDTLNYPPSDRCLIFGVPKEERGLYTGMDLWTKIRLEVPREESSKREILR